MVGVTKIVVFVTIVVGVATIVVDCDNCEHCDNCNHITNTKIQLFIGEVYWNVYK